jgi:hypothetical protein
MVMAIECDSPYLSIRMNNEPMGESAVGIDTFAVSILITRALQQAVTELDLHKSYLSFGAEEIVQDFCIAVCCMRTCFRCTIK